MGATVVEELGGDVTVELVEVDVTVELVVVDVTVELVGVDVTVEADLSFEHAETITATTHNHRIKVDTSSTPRASVWCRVLRPQLRFVGSDRPGRSTPR